jgi:hypothetical protein
MFIAAALLAATLAAEGGGAPLKTLEIVLAVARRIHPDRE